MMNTRLILPGIKIAAAYKKYAVGTYNAGREILWSNGGYILLKKSIARSSTVVSCEQMYACRKTIQQPKLS